MQKYKYFLFRQNIFQSFFIFFNLLKTSPKNIPNRQIQITHLPLYNQQILIASAKI